MNFTLYPIHWVADEVEDEQFDLRLLPFDLGNGFHVESLAGRFRPTTFDVFAPQLGSDAIESLRTVRFALVHRYDVAPIVVDNEIIGEEQHDLESEKRMFSLAACLRVIRPMRQRVLAMQGTVRDDGTLDVRRFGLPAGFVEVPEAQKLFKLRDQDVRDLRTYAPQFVEAALGDRFWKFKMAVQFHELGHFQPLDWKARYLLWCSAIESLYTSKNREHKGSLVATSRIKWFLGENTNIYPPGDLPNFVRNPNLTIGMVVGDVYELRNYLAHGDRVPDQFFKEVLRDGLNGGVNKMGVLIEAVSFIIRASLLKIVREGALHHFADFVSAEAFFGSQGLTFSQLQRNRP